MYSLYSGQNCTSDSGTQPSPYYIEWIILIIPGLFRVYSVIELALVRVSWTQLLIRERMQERYSFLSELGWP